jgi:hypothetical protein
MAENTIEIEVELVGQKETLKGLDKVKEGAQGIGETFKGAASLVGKSNQQMGEGLNSLSDAVGSSTDAISSMSSAIQKVGQGGASFTALLGPIGLVAGAIAAAYETYRQFSGAAKEAENRQEAFAAASGDLTSKLEALAEKGFVPATRELEAYSRANLRAQIQKELLAKQIEKIGKALVAEADAQKEVTRLQELAARVSKDQVQVQNKRLLYVNANLRDAQENLSKATAGVSKAFKGLNEETARVNKQLAEVGETYKGFEKQTKEALETKAKELIAQRKSIEELKAEASGLRETAQLSMKREAERRATADALKLEGMTREQLASFVKAQEGAIKALNVEALKDRKLAKQIAKLNADAAKARGGATDRIKAQETALRQLAIEQQRQLVLESQLRQLQIKLTKEGDDEQLALAQERYNTSLQLAKDNALQRQIVEAQYQLDVQQIEDRRTERNFQRLQAEEKALADSLQRQKDQRDAANDKMLADQKKQIDELGAAFQSYGQGLAQAAASNLLFGDSFKAAAGEVLRGLAIESTVRALMESAKGFAALFGPTPQLAAGYFKSAATFGAAAAAARVGAGALGVGGAGGASGGATASPSGAPQTAPTPQREQAESREMVFNLNFGGAVIYDTKEAAKRAMLGDLVRTYNQPNRGMPRFSSAR